MVPSCLSRFLVLPRPLLFLLIHAGISYAQSSQPLVLNQPLNLVSNSLPSPPVFSIPSSSTPLTISIAFCETPQQDGPRFFVTNNTQINDPGPGSGADVFEVTVDENGIGSVTLENMGSGGVFAVTAGTSPLSFEVGLSDSGPLHSRLTSLPFLGDTTNNQALLFSPPFLPVNFSDPTYPNYTLPLGDISQPPPPSPSQTPNFTLILGPTTSFPTFDASSNTLANKFPVTACALRNVSGLIVGQSTDPGTNAQASLWFRDADGWRTQWVVNGLQPIVNYTAYVVQGGTKVAGPIYMVTKTAIFSCPLAHSLPFCPATSYSVPLPPPPGTETTYDASNFPTNVSDPLMQYMTNFTVTLLAFACGRDWYSPLQSCADCQRAYRTWLCAISLPRCGEEPNGTASSSPTTDSGAQVVFPAVLPQPKGNITRNTLLPAADGDWVELLPCLETCNAADRACPNFLGFQCPIPRFNAAASYGVGYIDGDEKNKGEDWEEYGGITGASQDRWGHVWCNG